MLELILTHSISTTVTNIDLISVTNSIFRRVGVTIYFHVMIPKRESKIDISYPYKISQGMAVEQLEKSVEWKDTRTDE